MKDSLGNRMKSQYEDRTRMYLPRRTNTIIRLDGKAFHTFTKQCHKPFDSRLMKSMQMTAKYLVENIQGAKLAYTQSDEISILLTDYDSITTASWFDGNLQKIVSISAAMATAYFNYHYSALGVGFALFDSRAFIIPDDEEVINYFIWRQKDWCRNSLQMVAQSLYSHKELQGKKRADLHELLHAKGVNWATDYSPAEKNGTIYMKVENSFSESNHEFSNDKFKQQIRELMRREYD